MSADALLYVSSKCQHSAKIVAELRSTGAIESYKVIVVDAMRRHMLPSYVDRVPLMFVRGAVLTDEDLFDTVYGRAAAAPEAGGGLEFGSFCDVGAPLEGEAECDTMRNFYDLSRPPAEMVTPPDDVPDNRSFDMGKIKQMRDMDVPVGSGQRT